MKTTLTLWMPVEVELHLSVERDPVRLDIQDAEFVQLNVPSSEEDKQAVLTAMGEEKYLELLKELITRQDDPVVHIRFPDAMCDGDDLMCGRPVDEDTLTSSDILWLFTFLRGCGLCTKCERKAMEKTRKFDVPPM